MHAKLIVSIALFAAVFHTVSAAPPVPKVTISAPPQVLLGEKFTFTVTFENNTPPTSVGFAPFIDLVWDFGGADHNSPPPGGGGPCDGFTILSAEMVDVNGGPIAIPPQTSPAACGSAAPLPHPFGAIPFGPVIVPTSARMTTLALPFGSFESTQPKVTIKVTAQVHNFADVGHPLFIYARAGFRYGNDALDNPIPDPPILSDTSLTASSWVAQATVTPSLFIVSKKYQGPEQETATGPNFPREYEITVDVAAGQTITDLVVEDCLQSNMQYVGLAAGTTPGYTVLSAPPPCLKLKYPSVTGVLGPDIKVRFKFFIPLNDPNGPVLDPNNCVNATSTDGTSASGNWKPLDPRDGLAQAVQSTVAKDKITDKRFTIRKEASVLAVPAGPLRPGKIVKYLLTMEVSDFFTIGDIVVDDILSDGQTLLTFGPYVPSLKVKDRRGSPPSMLFSGTNLFQASEINAMCASVKGGTHLTFKVSDLMIANAGLLPIVQKNGILTGGHTFAPFSVPATAQITFYARVQDTFTFPRNPHDNFVDKDDPLCDRVTVHANIYSNHPTAPQPHIPLLNCDDDSSVSLVLPGDVLQKIVNAVTRGTTVICKPSGPVCSNSPNPPQQVRPGDKVTFELKKTLPSSDAEQLTVEDWLPLPIFNVSDPDANGLGPPGWNVGLILPCAPPPPGPGNACRFTPPDTLGPPFLAGFPTLVVGPPQLGTNSLLFDYGPNFNDPNNQPRTIDLLFTSTVTNQPFADGLFFTNVARECEYNTFGVQFCQVAIAQVNVRQPKLKIQKGVVATDNPNGVFNPSLTPAGKWKPFGTSCPRFNPPIASTNLGGLISSNLSNVDANDWLTFAIAVENTGGAPAYDIELADIIPVNSSGHPACMPSCFLPDYSALCVRRGDGVVLPFTTAPGGGGSTIIKLTNPLLPAGPPGVNIVIITFNAQLLSDILPGCCDNVAELRHYASQPGGPDFVNANLTPPFTDSATVCVNPIPVKSIVATSEPHTAPQTSSGGGIPKVTLGELVRYQIATAVPEGGTLAGFQLIDALPPGMQFMNDGTARLAFVSNGPGISHPFAPISSNAFNMSGNLPLTPTQTIPAGVISGGATCGAPVTFNLGNIQNNENDPDSEFVVIEFNALVCNVASNQNGTTLPNTFSVSVGGANIATSNPVDVVVVEPNLKITKIASPSSIVTGGTVSYTVTLTNMGTADAFDVQFADALPPGLTFVPLSVNVAGGCLPFPGISIAAPSVTCDRVPVNGVVTITYKAVANPPTCPATLTNQARITWTSLPGPKGTTGNATGSNTPGSSGNGDGERDGVTPLPALNDYSASTSASVTVNCPPCTQPPQGMVSWWPGDGNANDIQDGNHGILKNSATFAPGKVGPAFSFNGIAAYVEIPNSPTLDIATGHTVDLWVKVDAYPPAGSYSILVNKWVNGLEDKLLAIDSTGKVLYYLHPSFGGTHLSGAVLSVGTWYHIAATYDGTAAKIYINGGPPNASKPANGDVSDNNGKLYFGHNPGRPVIGEPFVPFKGQLDEVEWYNRALTTVEIAAIFNAGPGGKCKCFFATNETITCNPNGTFNYTVTLTNLSNFAAPTVNIAPITGNVTVSPNSIPVSLPPGGSTTVTMTIGGSGAVSGANVCLSIGLLSPGTVGACRQPHCITLPACQPIVCAPQPPHMVSWWPLNETSGNIVVDIKGGHNGTTTPGSIGMAGGNPTSAPLPKVGNALYFTNSNATVPGSPYNFGNGSFSIDAWVRGSQLTNASMGIVDKLDPAANPRTGFAFFVLGGKLQLLMGDGTAAGATYSSSGSNGAFTYSNTLWQHVAVTVQRSASGVAIGTFYINGAPAGTFGPPPNSVNNGVPLLIGSSRLNSPNCQSCEVALDEIEIFDEVVAASDIQAIFAAGSKGKCP